MSQVPFLMVTQRVQERASARESPEPAPAFLCPVAVPPVRVIHVHMLIPHGLRQRHRPWVSVTGKGRKSSLIVAGKWQKWAAVSVDLLIDEQTFLSFRGKEDAQGFYFVLILFFVFFCWCCWCFHSNGQNIVFTFA